MIAPDTPPRATTTIIALVLASTAGLARNCEAAAPQADPTQVVARFQLDGKVRQVSRDEIGRV